MIKMNVSISFAVLTLCSVVLFSGCKKTELTGDLAVYAGTWESINATMELKDNGRANFIEFLGTSRRSINGRLIISDSRIRITAVFASRNFNIDIPPTEQENEDGDPEMFMRLDGLDFIKK